MSDALEEHNGTVNIGQLRFIAHDIDTHAEEGQKLEALVESLNLHRV